MHLYLRTLWRCTNAVIIIIGIIIINDDITSECSLQAALQAMRLEPRDALSLSRLHRVTFSPRPAQPGTSL